MELALWALKPGWVAGTACSRPPLVWGLSHTALSRCHIYSGWLRASAWLQSSSTVPLQERSFEKTYGGWENLFAVSLTDPDCNLLGPELWAHLGAPPLRFQFLLTHVCFPGFVTGKKAEKEFLLSFCLHKQCSSGLQESSFIPFEHVCVRSYMECPVWSTCYMFRLFLCPPSTSPIYVYVHIYIHMYTRTYIHTHTYTHRHLYNWDMYC